MNSGQIERRLDEIEKLAQELRELLTSGDDVVIVHGQGVWRADMLALLWPRVEHLRGVRALFELCATRSPGDITFPQLVAHSGLSNRAQANEHARLSRVAREFFNRKTWPIESWQDSREGVMRYRMDPIVVHWWREIIDKAERQHGAEEVAKAISAVKVNDLAGRWVAQDGDDIVAVGDSPQEVLGELRTSGRRAVLRRVPLSGAEADVDLVA